MAHQPVHQPITPALRTWIVEQASAAQPPETIVQAMVASGWDEDVALVALESTLREHLAQHAAQHATQRSAEPSAEQARAVALPPAVAVPEPLPAGMRAAVWAHDREVSVLVALADPRVIVFGNLLSGAECDELIALASVRLERSETVQTDTGASEVNESRTSQGMFFDRGEHPVCARIEARMAALMQWPLENGEGLQVLRYGPGAEYKPHYDYFDPAQPGTPVILRRGGQRVASLVCYLNTPAGGGETVFPDVNLAVAPVRGNAVFFSYDRPHPVTRSLHGGAPVIDGEKWVATKWLREGRFE